MWRTASWGTTPSTGNCLLKAEKKASPRCCETSRTSSLTGVPVLPRRCQLHHVAFSPLELFSPSFRKGGGWCKISFGAIFPSFRKGVGVLRFFRYMPFFVEDFQWTAKNYACMSAKPGEMARWWQLASPIRKAIGQESLGDPLKTGTCGLRL